MKPELLVRGQQYEVKLERANKKRGTDGFILCTYIGTDGDTSVDNHGVTNQAFQFYEVNPRDNGINCTDYPWELFIGSLAKKVREAAVKVGA